MAVTGVLKKCADCGTVFVAENPASKYCPCCSARRNIPGPARGNGYRKPPPDALTLDVRAADAAVLAQAEQFLKYVKEAHKISFDVLPTIFRDGCRDPEELDDEDDEDVEPLTEPEEVAPGAQWDVVAIYDNAGIPSIMHRFRRMNDKDLFRGGKDKPHPAFIIGGEVYDEIYISVYQNTMINGKPYSLPYMEPVTDITADKFADACFSKGEGWHCMTAAEWGLLACLSWKNGTLPHGNTRCGKYHADPTECGVNVKDSNKTLTGSGPATWTHDHTPTGVHDLCGNVGEIIRGLRIKDGALWATENNDAALPETDLTTCGDGWKPIVDSNGNQVYVDAMDGIKFTNEKPQHGRANFESWEDVRMECWSDQLMELGLFAGEKKAYCAVDATEGEYLPFRGGDWGDGGSAGLFYLYLSSPRSNSHWYIGGRSAYFKKR